MITGSNTTVVTKNYVSMSSLVGARDPGVYKFTFRLWMPDRVRHDTLGFARLSYNRSIFTTVVLGPVIN